MPICIFFAAHSVVLNKDSASSRRPTPGPVRLLVLRLSIISGK